jgi:hypothetical protein
MKRFKLNYALLVLCFVLVAGIAGYSLIAAQEKKQEVTIVGQNYLYIDEMEIAPGRVPNEAIAEAQGWVKAMRETGEFKSVRLFIHNTGPRFALYILIEPKSWQALETGFEKYFAAQPGIWDKPFNWGAHSDNLLSEVPVK